MARDTRLPTHKANARGSLAPKWGRVMDPLGRVVLEQQVAGLVEVVELDRPEMATGIYIVGLFADGLKIGVTKFEFIR